VTAGAGVDLAAHVAAAATRGELVVQPRMGMSDPRRMAEGLRAVAAVPAATVGTITLDSYTRVSDHAAARAAVRRGAPLNGFPLVAHGAEVTARVVRDVAGTIPVQVRHGSAAPGDIFATMVRAGLATSEGGPVSYCLPYGRVPLAESVRAWARATCTLAEDGRSAGVRPHLETFGGCLLGQLCPPSLLVAVSVLEGLFFVQHGVDSVSLSYAQQTSEGQDVEALTALRRLAARLLPPRVDRHLVLYTYMGVYPQTAEGARRLLAGSVDVAVRGGAERLIVKTVAEAHRIPTVGENVEALTAAAARARQARRSVRGPSGDEVDASEVLAETTALVEAVLELSDDVGTALVRAFAAGLLDVPFCLHQDNAGATQGAIDADGRLYWADSGRLPLPGGARTRAGRITSRRLVTMLSHAARRFDGPALGGPVPAVPPGPVAAAHEGPLARIALVGTGPRGVAVLERLAARLTERPPARPVEILALDAVEVGCGRIWRTDQPEYLLMNTPAGEVTMFSGPPDDGPPRAGAGPSLGEWWQAVDPAHGDPNGYAPRALYGRYLRQVFDTVLAGLPAPVRVRPVRTRVRSLTRSPAGAWRLESPELGGVDVDRVVLTTGHASPEPDGEHARLAAFAARRPGARYVRADSAADMALDDLPAGSVVGVLGLGLSFYDVMAALTVGRGGRFEAAGDGLRYEPSGREPLLVAGSRSGVPVPARGRNQKPPDHVYVPLLFTRSRMRTARRRGPLDFRRDVEPWLLAEMDLVHHGTALRRLYGKQAVTLFHERVTETVDPTDPRAAVVEQARRLGGPALPALDLPARARPFAGRRFGSPEAYHRVVADHVRRDLAEAEEGNVDGPVKAALDTLRDVRAVLRVAVDHGGLTAASHREFLASFVPVASALSAGPPRVRLHQVLALLDAGVLRLLGPGSVFTGDDRTGRWRGDAAQVSGAAVLLDAFVDARIPTPDVRRDPAPLTRSLLRAGVWSSFTNASAGGRLRTGGVHVTGAPYHPVRSDGAPEQDLYVLGIPTEHTRWFTQVGSGRPGRWGDFTGDADAVAEHLMEFLAQRVTPAPAQEVVA
jgi:methylaspartate mutase epsilon subunit